MSHAAGSYAAAVDLPEPVADPERITLYARDTGAQAELCVFTFRDSPTTGTGAWLASVCTVAASDQVQAVSTTEISPRRVSRASQGQHLWVMMIGSTELCGLRVTYAS